MRRVPAYLLVASLIGQTGLAQAQEDTCDLGPLATGDGTATTTTYQTLCERAREAVDRPETRALDGAARLRRLLGLGEFLRRQTMDGGGAITSFVYDPGPQFFGAYCCSCTPGVTCSAWTGDVCVRSTDGTCPAGDFKAICEVTLDGEIDDCTQID